MDLGSVRAANKEDWNKFLMATKVRSFVASLFYFMVYVCFSIVSPVNISKFHASTYDHISQRNPLHVVILYVCFCRLIGRCLCPPPPADHSQHRVSRRPQFHQPMVWRPAGVQVLLRLRNFLECFIFVVNHCSCPQTFTLFFPAYLFIYSFNFSFFILCCCFLLPHPTMFAVPFTQNLACYLIFTLFILYKRKLKRVSLQSSQVCYWTIYIPAQDNVSLA